MTTVNITINTDDMGLVSRIGDALNVQGTTTGAWLPGAYVGEEPKEGRAPDPAGVDSFVERAEAAQKELDDTGLASSAFSRAPTATEPETTTPSASGATAPSGPDGQTSPSVSRPHADTPQPAPGEELDNDKLPWDGRINTANKGQTKGGVWKRKPGISNDLYEEVRAELQRIMAVPGAATPPPPAPEQGADTTPPPPPAPEHSDEAATPPPPPAPGQPVQDIKFPQLVRRVTAEGISQETVGLVLNRHGLVKMPDLLKRADLVPAVYADFFPEG